MTATVKIAGYVGWLKIGRGPWTRVVEDGIHGECLAKLMQHADKAEGVNKDLTVLPLGRHPDDRTTGKR